LALCAALLAVEWGRHGSLYPASDDSYIYLGYVKRALSAPRALFSYNPGEHSAGTTGLLYYYLLVGVCGALQGLLFFLSLERVLLLGSWLLNAGLFVWLGARYLAAARRLGLGRAGNPLAADAALFLLLCASPKFLWGVFCGLENPLSAFLVVMLFERLLARAPAWQAALASACLVATRPETLSVLWAAPFAAAIAAASRDQRRFAPGLAIALATFGSALVVLYLPCYLTTGSWLPSSLGRRAQLVDLTEPGAIARSLALVLGSRRYWSSEWPLFAFAAVALSICVSRGTRVPLLATGLALLVFYLVRGVLGLADFNAEDRYVSYLWPLHALVFAAAGAAALARLPDAWLRAAGSRLAAAALFALSLIPFAEFLRRFEHHVALMDQIVVQPSRWMQASLPAGSRICMEPAGAIRVFTDFYLIDATGLTTAHGESYDGDYLRFLQQNRVDFVFDRDEPAARLVTSGLGRELRTWAPGIRPWGEIKLFEVGPPRNAPIASIEASATPEGASASAPFDNAADGAGRPEAAWVSDSSPAWLAASLARPLTVDRVEISLRPARPPAASGALRVEGTRAGASIPFEAAPDPGAPRGGGPQTLGFVLGGPHEIDGIRILLAGGCPGILEVTLGLRETRYWWLDTR
jgi:hypothetical protein